MDVNDVTMVVETFDDDVNDKTIERKLAMMSFRVRPSSVFAEVQ